MKNEIEEIKDEYRKMWLKLGFDSPKYALATKAACGCFHVEYGDGRYKWIFMERGCPYGQQETTRKDELLEWIARGFTMDLAHQEIYEKPKILKDSREHLIRMLEYQIELLRKLNPQWGARREVEMKATHTWFPGATIIDADLEATNAWRAHLLQVSYPTVYLDCIPVKAFDADVKPIYLALGLLPSGKIEPLGVWIAKTEDAKSCQKVLTDLKNRGIGAISVACAEKLTGFSEATAAVYPKTVVQLGVTPRTIKSVMIPLLKITKKLRSFSSDDDSLHKLFYLQFKKLCR